MSSGVPSPAFGASSRAGGRGAGTPRAGQREGSSWLAAALDAGPVRGALQPRQSFADFIWFRCGGAAEVMFRPSNTSDLRDYLSRLPGGVPLMAVGVGSNLIIRDGGVPGVTVRLSKAFAGVRVEGRRVTAGAGAMGITVATAARDAGLAGAEFLRGIPGTIGGVVAMNAGAYGREIADILVSATLVTRDGRIERLTCEDLRYSYRHSELPRGSVVVEAELKLVDGDPAGIQAEMDRIATEREASQPLRTRTGGSTFKNPSERKAWQLIDDAGCRGLRRGGAQVSEKHCNFLLALDGCTSADLEALGEDVRARVAAQSGVRLEWEIARVGDPVPSQAELGGELP